MRVNRWTEPEPGKKLLAGFRPVRIVGVEVQYVDFGEATREVAGGWRLGGGQVGPFYEQTNSTKVRPNAWVLSALLFIPEQFPSFDVYGKVGVAALKHSFSTNTTRYECVPIIPCLSTVNSDVHESDARPYLGLGARLKVARAVAVRFEYESIDRDAGHSTTMLSLGFAWER
jgi:hypothetical protein